MLDARRLRYFVAVAEEGHFGRAALRLGISQPPLSEHIAGLEETVGAKLFSRTTRVVALTPEGEALLAHARQVLNDLDRCIDVVTHAREAKLAAVAVGLLHAHAYTFFPPLLRAFLASAPNVRVKLSEYAATEQSAKLLQGEVDVGFVRQPLYHPAIHSRAVFSEEYVLAVPAEWTLSRMEDLAPADLESVRLVTYPSYDDRSSTQSLFRDYFYKHGVSPTENFEVKTLHSALAAVAAGIGCAPVPSSQQAMQLSGVTYVPFRLSPPKLTVGLAWREDMHTPMVERFVAFCVDYFGRVTPGNRHQSDG